MPPGREEQQIDALVGQGGLMRVNQGECQGV
jgi:hypothetical protein